MDGLEAKNELDVQLCWGRGRSCREAAHDTYESRGVTASVFDWHVQLRFVLSLPLLSVVVPVLGEQGEQTPSATWALAQVSVLSWQPPVQQAHKYQSEQARCISCACVVIAPSSACCLRLWSITLQYQHMQVSIFFSTAQQWSLLWPQLGMARETAGAHKCQETTWACCLYLRERKSILALEKQFLTYPFW